MTTSLREEIAKRLWQIYVRNEYGIEEYKDVYEYEYGVHDWTKYTERDKKGYLDEGDEILQIVTKLIDSVEEKKEELDYHNGWSGDDEFWDGYELGFQEAFKLIKKEILGEEKKEDAST